MTKYTLYVDETGDTGIDKVREGALDKGASPFLVLGGCLVPDSREEKVKGFLASVKHAIGKENLHCKDLTHFQTAKFARMLAEHQGVLLFAFISKKETLGNYKAVISGEGQDQKYYNKCVSYFLERIGHFMLENEVDPKDLTIALERRERHDYSKLRNYISIIKSNPQDERLGYYLSSILPKSISDIAKSECNLLCLADLVAFSVSAAVNASKSNFEVPEQRYLRELKPLFFRDKDTDTVGEFGLKLYKRFSMSFDPETKRFLDSWHKQGVEPSLHKK